MTDTTETARQYAERDHEALDVLGGHYSRHVAAMTAEGLHAKSDIAAELAYRDAVIDSMRADAEIGRAWLKDSSLDHWFPFTASELTRLRAEHAKLLGFVREVMEFRHVQDIPSEIIEDAAIAFGVLVRDESLPISNTYRLAEFVRAP